MFEPTSGSCREIKTNQDLADLRESWTELLLRCSYPTPFCSWEWAWEWWRHFGQETAPGFRLLVALVHRSDGQLIGLAPFFFPADAGLLRLRPLRPLASRSHCTVDELTEEPMLLLHQGHADEALRAICRALLDCNGKRDWDLIHLRRMRPASDPSLLSLWRSLPRRMPFVLTILRQHLGQTRALPASWPDFRRSLSKSMRDNIVYYPRLLTREGHSWQVRVARSPEEVAEAVPVLIDLHHRRARSERGPRHTDHLPLPVQHQFLRAVLPRLAERNMAAVAFLEVDGVPVAAQSVLECQGTLTLYYSGFDPQWHRYSPITILHVALFQDAIARGLTRIDFLPHAEPWKTRWGTEAEFIFGELTCLSIRPRALLRRGWRTITRFLPFQRGLPCECGFCSEEEKRAALQFAVPGSGLSKSGIYATVKAKICGAQS